MTDCDKYKMFVEDNFMMEFIIWEQEIYRKQNGDNTTDITDFDIDITN